MAKLGHFLKIQNEVVMHHRKAGIAPKSMVWNAPACFPLLLLQLTGDGACCGPSVDPAGALWALIKVSVHVGTSWASQQGPI